ncbi:Ni/Fe hydrogenase subunit gamma [Burkholderia ubonensis]|nr:Ni/Fe hydrogenase subunit gamma [Burkholderia ubonensis]
MSMESADTAGAPPDDPLVPRIYRVARRHRELPDIATLEIVPLSGPRAPIGSGQFNMLYVLGVGEVPISTSGDPANDATFVHTIREVGAVSRALARLSPGATLGVRGPFGVGWPIDAAVGTDMVIVAGGLGLAPLRPAIYEIMASRSRFGRVAILFGCRHPDEILYRRELERWSRRLDVEVDVTVDHADAGWRGNVGVVPALIARAAFDPRDATALVCGPEVMMRFAVAALKERGVPDDHIYLSMERNMKCAVGHCGHCQFGPTFVCKDGPVMRYDAIARIFAAREI